MADKPGAKSATITQRLQQRAKALAVLGKPEGWRPQTRGDCSDVPRPCPYVSCRYNLTLDLTPKGHIRWRQDGDFDNSFDGRDNCALDVAARGPHTLQDIADISGVCRERIRQELDAALEKIAPALTINSAIEGYGHVYDYDQSPEDACMVLHGLNPADQEDRKRYRKLVDAMNNNNC
jgi:hypothetical protein